MDTMGFLTEIQSLYGSFNTEGMMRAVAARISPLTDSQRDRLLDVYCRTIPGNWRPDLKCVMQCMESGNIRPPEKVKGCASCGHRWTSTQVECPVCCYTQDEGDPIQYHHEFVNDCGRFNRKAVQELLAGCTFLRRSL